MLGRMLLACALGAAVVQPARALDLVTVETAFNKVTVARSFAPSIVPLLAEIKKLGVRARVKCYAATRGPHVPRSLHLIGEACDVLPLEGRRKRGARRNRMPTPPAMFSREVAGLIARAGLRNGCAFRDCGHIDSGRSRSASSRRPAHRS